MKENPAFRLSIALIILSMSLSFPATEARADQAVTISDYNAGTVTEFDFEAGQMVIPGLPVLWESDTAWRLLVNSVDPDLGISDDATYTKPLGDLMWRRTGDDVWLPLSREPEEVAWSDEAGSGVIYIDVLVMLDWLTDAPGEYRVDLVFTLEAF